MNCVRSDVTPCGRTVRESPERGREGLRARFLSLVLRVVSMLVNRTGRLHPQDKSLFADRFFVANAAAQSAPVIPLSQGCF